MNTLVIAPGVTQLAPVGGQHSRGDLTVPAFEGPPIISPKLQLQPPTETQHITVVSADNSGSMYGSGAIVRLQQVLPQFIQDLNRDASIRASVLMTFACFGPTRAFEPLGAIRRVSDITPPELVASGLGTPLCKRLVEGIAFIMAARNMLRTQLNVSQRKSWLIEFTDGEATDIEHAAAARHAVRNVAAENGIDVFLYGVGEGADMAFLHSIEQQERPAELLKSETNFADLFRWLHQSLRSVSQKPPGKSTDISSPNGNLFKTQ